MSAAQSSDEKSQPAGKYALVPRRALRDGVYDAILQKLLDGSTPPGSSLNIDLLSRELGVSQTPVREALVQMEHTGLVTRAALKGYRVAQPLSPEQMAELMAARGVVEIAAVQWAAGRTADLLPDLRAAHARHELAAREAARLRDGGPPTGYADLRAYFAADWDFHMVIIRTAGNRFLVQMAESVNAHAHRLRQSVDHGTFDFEQAVAEHAAILAAFESGDPEAPVAAMRAHLAAIATRARTGAGG
ncbi:GntR family transcriptional regulator [Streptomyces sp. URMC 129]|uniref:GntR family transcriptional regulator n=1 Tax=Streptomyces sp. URMC 129 TaxID=3423407 RepID=UPI003F1C0E79